MGRLDFPTSALRPAGDPWLTWETRCTLTSIKCHRYFFFFLPKTALAVLNPFCMPGWHHTHRDLPGRPLSPECWDPKMHSSTARLIATKFCGNHFQSSRKSPKCAASLLPRFSGLLCQRCSSPRLSQTSLSGRCVILEVH